MVIVFLFIINFFNLDRNFSANAQLVGAGMSANAQFKEPVEEEPIDPNNPQTKSKSQKNIQFGPNTGAAPNPPPSVPPPIEAPQNNNESQGGGVHSVEAKSGSWAEIKVDLRFQKAETQHVTELPFLSKKYRPGPNLLFDCDEGHYGCVDTPSFERCLKRRKEALFRKKAYLICAPLRIFKSIEECNRYLVDVVNHPTKNNLCYQKVNKIIK